MYNNNIIDYTSFVKTRHLFYINLGFWAGQIFLLLNLKMDLLKLHIGVLVVACFANKK